MFVILKALLFVISLLYIYRQICQAPISLILKVCQSFFCYGINRNMNISNESAIYDNVGHHNVFTIAVQKIMSSNFEPLANWERGRTAEKIVSRNGERFCKCYEFHNVFSSSVVVSMPLL